MRLNDFKKVGLSIVFIFLILNLFPCAGFGKDIIRFGVLPVVDTLPLVVGQQAGLFDKEGIKLEIISFQSALERDAALWAGKLDGYFGDILNTVLLIHAGQKIKIITTAFHTHPKYRMFGIAASPASEIKDLSGLKGKQVAISRASIIEYLLDRILAGRGFSPGFVEKQEIKKIPIRLQMLLSNQVPAALLPEPLLTLAECRGAKILADDRTLNTSLTVLAMQIKTVNQDTSLMPRFLRAYGTAVKKINQDPEAYKDVLVTHTRFPESIKDRYQIPVFPEVKTPLKKDIMAAQQWLIKNGMDDSMISFGNIVFESSQLKQGL